MKKSFYVLILLVSFSSVTFAEDSLIGNVRGYKRSFSLSVEDCLKNIRTTWENPSYQQCEVAVMENNENESSISSQRLELKDVDFKGKKALIHATGAYAPNRYTIFAEWKPAGPVFTKEDFAELIKMLIKEKGSKISIKYLKIEEK